jgi:anti-anti-sigma factor
MTLWKSLLREILGVNSLADVLPHGKIGSTVDGGRHMLERIPMKLTIDATRTEPGAVTLTLRGPLDGQTCTLLDGEVGRALSEPICAMVLDLTGVNFITSAGIAIILKARTSLMEKKADLAMIGMQPQVRKAFEIIRVLPLVKVFRNQAELDEYLGRIQRQMTGQED